MAVKEKTESVPEEFDWNVDTEVQLFYAMHGHKPVGVNKHFQMACILEKFRNSINKDVSSKAIWEHLDTMYDMQALDDTENLPFPNDPRDFTLPEEADYNSMMDIKRLIPIPEEVQKIQAQIREELRQEALQKAKEAKEAAKKESSKDKDSKENTNKKDSKESKESVKEKKEKEVIKEPKKIAGKEVKESRRESKDGKETKKDTKKEVKEAPKESKKEPAESNKETKPVKSRSSVKDKKESKKEEEKEEPLAVLVNSVKKERVRELSESKSDDSSPKRGAKRSTRGSIKPDDTSSTKSASPITIPTPPPSKRRRT